MHTTKNTLIIVVRSGDRHKDAYSNFTSIRWKRRCAGSSPAGREGILPAVAQLAEPERNNAS